MQVRTALRKAAGLRRVMGRGGHMDEGLRKLWAAELIALRPYLANHGRLDNGLMLLDGEDAQRGAVEGFTEASLALYVQRMVVRKQQVVSARPPPRTQARGSARGLRRQQERENGRLDGTTGADESRATPPDSRNADTRQARR